MKTRIRIIVVTAMCIAIIPMYHSTAGSATIFEEHRTDFEYDTALPLDAEEEVIEESSYYTK